jgi:two-component system chemotaxis response regulator CheB
MIKTLIVDDSILVRSIIRDFLVSDGSFEIIGEAENGIEAVTQAQLLNPDLITMDIEMPVMDGLQAISEIKKNMSTAIVVFSTHDTAKMVYDAVVSGAFEFFSKEILSSQTSASQREQIFNTLKHITGIKARAPARQKAAKEAQIMPRRIDAVVIASSTGGPKALCQLCAEIPKEFSAPIVLVQHNTTGFDKGFVQWLDGYTPLHVCLAEEAVTPVKGNLYVAPTDRHLLLDKKGFQFDDGEPVNNQKPAADVMFKSAADLYGESLVSVVLTGMGSDGAGGTRYVKNAGGITIAQDEASSMINGMPQAAVDTGCVDITLPLDKIAQRLTFLAQWSDRV